MYLMYQISLYFLISLLFLKLLEMVRCIIWALKDGNKVADRIHSILKIITQKKLFDILSQFKHPTFPGNTIFTKWILKLYGWKFTWLLSRLLFRFPTLMLLIATFGFNAQKSMDRYFICFILLVGIIIESVHLLVYRYVFGSFDNFLNSFSVRFLSEEKLFPIPKRVVVRRFILIYLATFLIIVVSYASIYANLAEKFIENNFLIGINETYSYWIQAIYFSTATVCTVGYGDIKTSGSFSQLINTSEMFVGFILLVLLLTAFSSTISISDE